MRRLMLNRPLLLHLGGIHYIGMKCIRVRCVMHKKIFHTIENGWYDEIWYEIHTEVV